MEADGGRPAPGRSRVTALLVAGLIGAAIGTASTYAVMDRESVTPTIFEGMAAPNYDASGIAFDTTSEGADLAYPLVGAKWSDGHSWHDWSTDNCLTPLGGDQPIRLGIVDTDAMDEAPGGQVVVWFQCLRNPP